MKKISILFFALTALVSGTSFADEVSDNARQHFQAIGVGDLSAVMQEYGANPQLTWIGGPLDGSYSGAASISAVWTKLNKAQGPLKVSIDKLEESANPKGATVTADVRFEGKDMIKVRYVLTYRDAKLVNETWQIDPKLGASTY